MHYSFPNRGTCSVQVDFDLAEDGTVHGVSFTGGCNGNLKAIGKLVEGLPAEEVIRRLKGNTCGMRTTSCADQFARALEKALASHSS